MLFCRSASPSITPATQSEANLEITAAHFCSSSSTPGTMARCSTEARAALQAMASGMDSSERNRLPTAALRGRPRSMLWVKMYRPLARAMYE